MQDSSMPIKEKIADDFAQLAYVRAQIPFVRIDGRMFELVSVSGGILTDLDILSCNFNLKPVVLG